MIRSSRPVLLLLLLLLHLAGFVAFTAAQQTRCAPKFSFFPRGGEDRNVPHAWGKTAQMAAGNYKDDTMFNIVLTSSNNLPGIISEAVPILHVAPVHPLLVMGSANLPASCTGFVPQPTPELWVNKAAAETAPPAAAAGAAQAVPAAGAATDIAESAKVAGPADTAAGEPAKKPAEKPAAAAAGSQPHSNVTAPAPAQTLAAGPNSTAASQLKQQPQQQQPKANATATRQLLQSSSSSEGAFDWAGWQEDAADGAAAHPGRHLLGGEAVTTPAMYRLQYSLNGSTPVDTGDVSILAPVQRITLNGLRAYPDGYYCLSLKLTIVQGSGRMGGYIQVPPFDLHSMTQVCFYKLDGAPSGRVKISSCSENLGVTFQDLRPQPIPLHPGSPRSLFNSVFYFHANLNRTEDWTWPSDATPMKMAHWLVADARTAIGRPQLWVPEEKLADGWYNLRLEASVTSDFPSLLALNSMRSGKYDGLDTPPELAEKPKYLASPQYKNGTVAGVQYVPTEFKQLTGPDADLRLSVGDEMTLNWEFDGFGDTYCYSDGKLFNNMGDFNCRSPVQIRIPDKRDHTFRVALQDVCNQTFIVDAVYGPWGYKVLRAPPPRAKTEEQPYVVNNGERFEVGDQPASQTLRAPKAAAAKANANAGALTQPPRAVAWLAWALGALCAALLL